MSSLFLTFGSTHATLKADRVLRGGAFPYRVVQKPPQIRGSCGLAVRVRPEDGSAVIDRLEQAGIPPRQQLVL